MNVELNPIPIGTKFGDRTVIAPSTRDRHRRVVYLCACACGVQALVSKQRLVAGRSQRCTPCARKFEHVQHVEHVLSAFKVGAQHGNQTVAKKPVQTDRGEFLIPCVCACGAETLLSRGVLLAEKGYRCQACKHKSKPGKLLKPLIYAVGDKVGSWTVSGSAIVQPKGLRYWPCICDCGRQQNVRENRLRSSETMACRSCCNRVGPSDYERKEVPQTLRHACEALEAARSLDDRVFRLRKAKYEKVLAAFKTTMNESSDEVREAFEAELKEIKERIAKLNGEAKESNNYSPPSREQQQQQTNIRG